MLVLWLNHAASIKIASKTGYPCYSHVAPGLQEAAAKGFDDILKKESSIDKELVEIIR